MNYSDLNITRFTSTAMINVQVCCGAAHLSLIFRVLAHTYIEQTGKAWQVVFFINHTHFLLRPVKTL